jgi:hypothetical protein
MKSPSSAWSRRTTPEIWDLTLISTSGRRAHHDGEPADDDDSDDAEQDLGATLHEVSLCVDRAARRHG